MIKAIIFDLDGTLLDSRKRITASLIDALQQCKNNGIKLFVATARPPIFQKMLSLSDESFGLFDGGIYCNGAFMKTSGFSKYIYIPSNVVSYCIDKVCIYERLNIALQMKNEVHAFRYPLSDITRDNDNDGIAYALKTLLKIVC